MTMQLDVEQFTRQKGSFNAWFAKPELRTDKAPVNMRGLVFTEYMIDPVKHPGCTCWINTERDYYVEGAAPFRVYEGNVRHQREFPNLIAALRWTCLVATETGR